MDVGKLARAVVHIDFTDSYMVKFVPDLDSNININHQESQGAPINVAGPGFSLQGCESKICCCGLITWTSMPSAWRGP